ncbi:MAG: Ldh family oxidoreductase [Rhodospirillaceae bacterium]|nr:Ldh family oxidoreductase [Rhodospirillaceae bacterium]
MNAPLTQPVGPTVRVGVDALDRFCRAVLVHAGADRATADAATRAMMHASRLGIDSHGVRLLDHYATVLTKGRVNPSPHLSIVAEHGAVATLDADNGHGATATFAAMDHAIGLAKRHGIGAVAVRNSSHFGPAGAYPLVAAEAGLIGLVVSNSDAFVRLHDGAARFHGTNPIACAVPVPGQQPWLLDMATSTVPYNRVMLYKSLGVSLPPGAASSADGVDTLDPEQAVMLAPLGAAFGYKGAGLAGLIEIFSALLSGMRLGFEILPMAGPDLSTPRAMGAFVLAIDPAAFVEPQQFGEGMVRYLEALRRSPARAGETVMAPGDREWAEAEHRAATGIPIDPATYDAFRRLARTYAVSLPEREAAA